MEIKKYHRRGPDGIPESIKIPEGFHNLIYSKHAKERFEERHGRDPIYPMLVNIMRHKNVIEVYTEDDVKPAQLLVSLQYRKYTRIYLVIIPFENKTAFVKTLWFSKPINKKTDEKTQDKEDDGYYPTTFRYSEPHTCPSP